MLYDLKRHDLIENCHPYRQLSYIVGIIRALQHTKDVFNKSVRCNKVYEISGGSRGVRGVPEHRSDF